MANQPEAIQYDSGVYQLEIADPVQGGVGGVSNKPLLNLANRTAYLKSHVDALEAGTTIPPTVAPLNSPVFTGDPKAPTAALGDNDTSIATTAFVQATLGGVLTKSVAGGVNVSLSAVEAGNGILVFTGALSANIAVIVPNSPTRPWIVQNNTTGGYSLTVKTAAGSGVAVTQGRSLELYCDGTNVQQSTTDFASPALTGVPTAPTAVPGTNTTQLATTAFVATSFAPLASPALTGVPTAPTAATATNTTQIATTAFVKAQAYATLASPALTGSPTAPTAAQFDNSTLLATTAFVQRALGNFQGAVGIAATSTLNASDVGKMINVACGSAGQVISLPAASGLPIGAAFVLYNMGNAYTLSRSGTDLLSADGSNKTSFAIPVGAIVFAVAASGGSWFVGGPGLLSQSGDFSSAKSGNGYQKLPSGLILQWGQIAVTTTATVTLPIVFPTAILEAYANAYLNNGEVPSSTTLAGVELNTMTASSIKVNCSNAGARTCAWWAIGY